MKISRTRFLLGAGALLPAFSGKAQANGPIVPQTTFDFREASVRDALGAMMDLAGCQYVIDKDVQGGVTGKGKLENLDDILVAMNHASSSPFFWFKENGVYRFQRSKPDESKEKSAIASAVRVFPRPAAAPPANPEARRIAGIVGYRERRVAILEVGVAPDSATQIVEAGSKVSARDGGDNWKVVTIANDGVQFERSGDILFISLQSPPPKVDRIRASARESVSREGSA